MAEPHTHALEIGFAVIGLLTSGFIFYNLGKDNAEAKCRAEKVEMRFETLDVTERLRLREVDAQGR